MISDRYTAEPWLRGTLTEIPIVPRAVLHSLDLAREDVVLWCGELSDGELNARPADIAPVAFHIRHVVRSIDRLLTYAEGFPLSPAQISAMKTELDPDAVHDSLFQEFNEGIKRAASKVRLIGSGSLEEPRKVGEKELPTTVGGLLIHVAEHTQRHVGQAITTAKLVIAPRNSSILEGSSR